MPIHENGANRLSKNQNYSNKNNNFFNFKVITTFTNYTIKNYYNIFLREKF